MTTPTTTTTERDARSTFRTDGRTVDALVCGVVESSRDRATDGGRAKTRGARVVHSFIHFFVSSAVVAFDRTRTRDRARGSSVNARASFVSRAVDRSVGARAGAMVSERMSTPGTPAKAGRSATRGRGDRWREGTTRSGSGVVKRTTRRAVVAATTTTNGGGGGARRAVRIVGAAAARDEDGEDGDDERFGAATKFGGKGDVVVSFDVEDDDDEEDVDVIAARRRPGAGKVGMAGFDGYPGFASFSWMTEAAYEEYEDSHEHEHEHEHDDDEMEETITESVVVSRAKTTDETTVTTTVTTTSTETSKSTSTTVEATRVGELARGPVLDTETKVIYAGVATAAALLGAKSFGGGKVRPPTARATTSTSTVGEKTPRDAETDEIVKPKKRIQIRDPRSGKVASLPEGTTKVAAVAGVLSAAATVAIVSGASLPRIGGGVGSAKSKGRGSDGSITRLERLRQSMILEFEDEIAKLGRMEVEKNNELKALNDNFKRSLTGVKLGSLRDEALSGAASGDEQNQKLQKAIAEMERHHRDEIKAKEASFEAQAETLKASIAKLQNALQIAESALREAEEVNKSMASQHEVELRAARGLIRAERELGRSEANKYRAARDLERVHVVNLRSALALAKVTSGERLKFLEDQLKAICSSYSARIIRERAEFAAKLEEAQSATKEYANRAPLPIEDSSTTRDEFASKIAEVRAEADAEISNLLAKHASAMRSASGERRALKVLYDSEMRKGATGKTRSDDSIVAQLRGEIAAREVAISATQNDAIRDAQIDFEKRVVALKNAHKAEIEKLQANASRGDDSSDRIRALEEAHQMSIKATAEAHARALEEAEAEASKRVAEAEERARGVIAKLNASEAAKAQILAQFDAERTDIADQLQSEQLKGKEDIEAMRTEYDEMLVRAVAQVQAVANDEKEKLEASIRELQERVAADKAELDRLREQVAGKGADLSAEVAQLQKQLDERAEIERDLRSQIAAAKQTVLSSAAESDSEREALRAQVTRLEAQLADMKKSKEQYDATIESMKKSASTSATDGNQSDAQISALKQQLEEQSRLLEDQKLYAEDQLVEAVAELRSENEMLTAKLRALNATTTSFSASQLNDAVRDAQIDFEQRVVALKQAHREELERAQKAARQVSASNSDREFIEAVAKLQAEKAELEAKIRALSASTASANASPTMSAAQLNDAVRDAQIQFEQRVVALKKAHREELERVEGMLARAKQEPSEPRADTGELERLRSQLAAEVEKFDQVSADLQRIMAEDLAAKRSLRDANAKIERLQSELTQAKQSPAPSTSGSAERRDDGEVERLRSQLAAEVDKFNHVSRDLERIMADDMAAKRALRSANLEIERLRDEASRPSLAVKNDDELVKAVAEIQAELAAEVEKFDQVSADLQRIMVDDMAAKNALRAANAEIKRLQLELSEAKQASNSSSSEVQRLQDELKAAIQKLDDLSAESQRIKADDLVAKDKLRQANAEIDRLRADLTQPKQTAMSAAQLNDAVRDAQIQFEQRVVALKKAHREELERVEGMLARAKQDGFQNRDELDRLRVSQPSLAAAKNDDELVKAVAEIQAELAAEVEKYDQVSADLERIMVDDMAAKNALREANSEIERLRLELTKSKQSPASGTDGESERLRAQLEAEVKKYDQVSQDLQRLMADDLAAKSALRDARDEVERLRATLATSGAQAKSSSDRELIEAVAELQAEKAALEVKLRANTGASVSTSQLDDAVRDAQIDFERRVAALKQAHREELERVKKAAPQASPSDGDREFIEAVAQLQSEKAELEDDLRALNATVAANASATMSASQLNDAVRDAQIDFEQRVVALKQAHREELERAQKAARQVSASNSDREFIEAVAKLQAEKAELEAKIRALSASTASANASPTMSAAQLNDAVRDAQIQFEQRVVALKKAHREELERVEGMLARAKQEPSEPRADTGELERLRSQLAAEVEKFDQVSADLQRIMAEDLAAKRSLRDANAKIERLQSELTQAKQSPAPSTSGSAERRDDGEVERLRSQLAAEVDKFNHVSRDLERIMADDMAAKRALRSANLEIERLRDEASRPSLAVKNDELVKEVAEIQAELAAEVEKFDQVSADLQRIMAEDLAAKRSLRDANAKIERLQSELTQAKQSPAPSTSGSAERRDDGEVERLRSQLAAEVDKFNHVSRDLERIMADDMAAKRALRSANLEIERLRDEASRPSLAVKNDELVKEVAEIQAELAAEVEKFDQVSADLQRIMADDLDAKRELREANAQIDRLRTEMSQAAYAASTSDAEAEVERLRTLLASEMEKFDHVSGDLERILADDLEAKSDLRDAEEQIERLKNELTTVTAKLLAENDRLKVSAKEATMNFDNSVRELEDLRVTVSKLSSGSDLSQVIAELQVELVKRAAIESELRAQVDATKMELDALRSKRSDTVITLPKFVKYTFQGGSADSKQISKLEKKVATLESQLADMQKAKEQYDATISSLKTTASDVSPTAVVDSAQVDQLKRQLADQSKFLSEEKERAEKELVEAVARMKLLAETDKANYEAALQSNEKQLIEAVAELQSLAGSEKAALEASLKASRGERRQLYAMMRSELLKNAASSKVDFTAEVASAEARSSIYWEQKLKEAEEKNDAQLASLTQTYEAQIASLKAGSGASDDVVALQKQLDEVRQRAEQELVRAVAEIQAAAAADITAIRALVKSESDERFSKAENAFNEEKAALLKAHKDQIEALESTISGSLSQDEQMKLKAAEDAWKTKLREVENSAKIRAQESTAEHEATVKRLEKQLSEVRDGYEATIKTLNKQLAQSASATERKLQRDLAQARDDLERFMRDQSSGKNATVKYTLPESITYKFQGGVNEVKRLKSQRDAIQKKLDALEAEYASTGADSVIENRISELKAELESTRAERDRDIELLTNRFKTENAEVERRMQRQLESATRAAEKAEKKYKKAIGESGGWRFSLFGRGKVQDANVNALNDDMRDKASLLKAAEEELLESKKREDELRREAARLTSELERAISNSSEEIDALKKEFSKNVEAASSNFAVDMKATVDKYETQIAKIESMAKDEEIAVVAEMKAEAQQEMARVVAELKVEVQRELVRVVARLNEERDASIAAAETKYALELKRTSESASASASEEVTALTRALAKLEDEKRLLQMDVVAWKDQVKSYEEQLAKAEAARKDLLDKYQNSRAILTDQLAKSSELEKRYHDDMLQAVAQSMAEATVQFNASLQESESQTKEVRRELESLRAEFDARVRDAAKKENKRLRNREQELEKQLKRAQRDYTNQSRKMDKLASQLAAVQSEYKAAEEKWGRSMRLLKDDFEQRLKKEQVTLAEKIAFYEQRVTLLTEELTLAKDQAKSASNRAKSESTAPARPLFEFNKGKLAAEQAAREDAERQLLAAKSEMEALRTQLLAAEEEVEKAKSDLKISEINRSKEVAQAREEGAKAVPLFQRLFGAPQKATRPPPSPKVVEKVVQKSEDSTKVKALEDELAAAAKRLSELKTASRAEVESAKKKIRDDYEAKLKILQSKVASLEEALSRSDEIAKEKLAMAMEAAQAEKDRMEKTLRAEIAAAKTLVSNAKLSAQRELSSLLRDAEARAKRDLRQQAKRAADERAESEAEIRANAKKAIKKLQDKISKFETMLDERDLEIEAKFNAQFDKLVVDFRQEVEILQKSLRAAEKRAGSGSEPKVIEKVVEVEKIVEKVVKADVDGAAYATEITKTKEDLAALRKRSEDDIAKLRASYEERLRKAIDAKDAALKESREQALKAVSSQKEQAQEKLKAELDEREKALKAEKALKQQLKRDREKLERSFEKTVSERDSYAREVETLKASLAEAKRRLRDLVDMSDEESRVLEESKKVASELDELKARYAKSMGISVSEVNDEDVAGLEITTIGTVVARRTETKSQKKTTVVDYFKQLLDMSEK